MTESVRTLWLAATLICLIANHGGVVGVHGVTMVSANRYIPYRLTHQSTMQAGNAAACCLWGPDPPTGQGGRGPAPNATGVRHRCGGFLPPCQAKPSQDRPHSTHSELQRAFIPV